MIRHLTEQKAKKTKLTRSFTLWEFLKSDKALELGLIPNQLAISPDVYANLILLSENVLQPLRDYMQSPVLLNSGFRCLELNEAINGALNSEHMIGRAADIVTNDNEKAFEFLKGLKFRQLIKYKTFIHVSYNIEDNKKQVILK